jgi:hypothetical protein
LVVEAVRRDRGGPFKHLEAPRDPVHLEEVEVADRRVEPVVVGTLPDRSLLVPDCSGLRERIAPGCRRSDSAPVDRIPRVRLTNLPERGQEEQVVVLRKEIDAVLVSVKIRPGLRLVDEPSASRRARLRRAAAADQLTSWALAEPALCLACPHLTGLCESQLLRSRQRVLKGLESRYVALASRLLIGGTMAG